MKNTITWFRVTDDDIKEARKEGHRREQNAIARGARHGYGLNCTPEESLRYQIIGAIGEMLGGWFYLMPCIWNRDQPNGEADIEDFVEVKTPDGPNRRLHVPLNGHPDRAYMQVTLQRLPYIGIVGWQWGRDVMEKRNIEEPQPGRKAYYYNGILRPPSLLYDEVRKRQRERGYVYQPGSPDRWTR